MKTMLDYTIYCTPEQTKKALELGAPIGNRVSLISGKHYIYEKITAEQMIGWLQSKGCYPFVMPVKHDGKKMIAARFLFYVDGGSTDTFCGFGEDNSVILNAIDKALGYLSKNKNYGTNL